MIHRNVTRRRISSALPAILLTITGLLSAADTGSDVLKNSGSVDRLSKKTGVYNASSTGKTPGFVVDPSWPQPLPNNWLLGQIGGLYVDQHDHVWVYNRPRTMSTDEAGLEGPVPGATDEKGQPINGLGQVRAYGPVSECCKAAPSVLEFDSDGKMLRAWGGPSDPGFIGGKCKAETGCIWPNNEHGIYVDQKDNVWISGNSAAPSGGAPKALPWTTHKDGGDGLVLKFDMNGNFKMRIGGTPGGPNSNDTNGGINGTPLLYLAADMVVDPATNRLYISDGYGNRRVLIVDADTGKYIGHFGAYGNNPVNDAAAEAAGAWIADSLKGNKKPAFFRNPVHCVKIANDGKMYVCDRGNDRIQVFDKNDPTLGKACSNPAGQPGTCGFIAEQFISDHTNIIGTAVSMNFSTDKAQSCLYVGDNANMTIYILNRSNLQELGQIGRHGRGAGEFHYLHQVSVDSKGNIYTGEVDTAKRIQKFLRFGATGCSGTGSSTVGAVTPAASLAQLNVITPGGFAAPLKAILSDFQKDTGITVVTTRGQSQGGGPNVIAAQLRRGMPADVVIMAREGLNELIADSRIVAGTDVDLAQTPLGVSVRAGAAKPNITTVDAFKQTLLQAKSITFPGSTTGIYMLTKLFPQLGIADKLAGKITQTGVADVANGNAELAIQPVSELLHVEGTEFVGKLPGDIQYISVFSCAAVQGGKQLEASKRLIAFLRSEKATEAIRNSGMEPLAGK
jgi:ABC-type molybdate transport system substrate-binding protein